MEILSWIKVSSNLVFICLVLCVSKSEQRVSRRIQSDHISNSGPPTVQDETQGLDLIQSFPFFRAAIPTGIYDCITTHGIMRCMKIYVLRKMEEHKFHRSTGNVTRDFLEQFADERNDMENLHAELYDELTDDELSKRLVLNFQQFFKNRDIKLHFLPGIMVRIVPSKDNRLKFSFKKKLKSQHTKVAGRALKTTEDEPEENLSIEEPSSTPSNAPIGELKGPVRVLKKRKNKKEGYDYKNAVIQLAVPVMVMPAVLLGSILPFLLPVLKMATIMTLVMNHSAFIAALIYAARTHANAQEEQHISYGTHPAYH